MGRIHATEVTNDHISAVKSTIHDMFSASDSTIDERLSRMESNVKALLVKLAERQSSSISPETTLQETNISWGEAGEAELSESENDIANAILKLKNPPAPKDIVQTESRLASNKENEDCISPALAPENNEALNENGVENKSSSSAKSASGQRKSIEDNTETGTNSQATKVYPTKERNSEKDEVGKNAGAEVSETRPVPLATESRPGSYKIFVISLVDFCIISLMVKISDSVSDVKAMIHSEKGIPPRAQRLLIRTSISFDELEDTKSMADYNIEKESYIYLRCIVNEIYVETLTETITLDALYPRLCIYTLKEKIQKKLGIPPKKQILFFDGKELEDNKPVDCYYTYDKCTLKCVVALSEKDNEDHISPVLAPENHEPPKGKLVENNSSLHKSENRKRKVDDDDTGTTTKSTNTKKVKSTNEADSAGKRSGESASSGSSTNELFNANFMQKTPSALKGLAETESRLLSDEAGKRIEKMKLRSEELAENLVGLRINVFWPEDGEYYKSVIKSYDPSTKTHKVSCEDGDTETLLLRQEKWNRIEDDFAPDSGTKSKRDEVGKNVGTKVSAPFAKS